MKIFNLYSRSLGKANVIVVLMLVFITFESCSRVPIMGRRQMLLVSDSEVLTSSFRQYDEYIKSATVDRHSANAKMVQRVGKKISLAVENYMNLNGLSADVKNFKWEFNYVKDMSVNAFCMPGGKIVVMEGIMQVIDNENDLAVVLSHEVAHAVAKHSNERMSQAILVNLGGTAMQIAVSEKSDATKLIANTVFGLGAQIGVMLPYSRKHEYEADELGLYFMAMAGYDPSLADKFWVKMASLGKGKPPEILSSHPSDENRVKRIQKKIPEVLEYMENEK